MALALVMATSTSFAKTAPTADFGYTTQSKISTETINRVLKLASEQVTYSYAELVEMHSIGQVTVAETNETNVYLVSIQQADGGIVEVAIEDTY